MKRNILFLLVCGLLFGCGNNTPKPNNASTESLPEPQQTPFAVEAYSVEDSHVLATIDEGDDAYKATASFKCEIDIPETSNQALRDSICYWFSNQFGSTYDGDPQDVKAMVNYYKDWALDSEDEDVEEGFDLQYTFKLIEATDQYVTYIHSLFFEADSSPRASQEETHVTFDSNTGKRFTRQMINQDETLENLVMNELLEQYFSDWNPEELSDLLFFDPDDLEEFRFSLPQFCEPWIVNNSVHFGYSEHEIADRCTGQPECSLPYSVIEPYLTEEGKAFFAPAK